MDLLCEVCNEPWDSYGVIHGDMAKWESKLFRHGAGCPCCEGDAPEGLAAEDALYNAAKHALFEAPDYCEDTLFRVEFPSKRPRWTRPEDPLVKECTCCTLQLKRDVDDGELYWNPRVSSLERRGNYDPSRGLGDATEDAFATWSGQEDVCEKCQISCTDCMAELLDDDRDVYDEGRVFHQNHDCYMREPLCMECWELREHNEAEEALAEKVGNVADRHWFKMEGTASIEMDFNEVRDILEDLRGKIDHETTEDEMADMLEAKGFWDADN